MYLTMFSLLFTVILSECEAGGGGQRGGSGGHPVSAGLSQSRAGQVPPDRPSAQPLPPLPVIPPHGLADLKAICCEMS